MPVGLSIALVAVAVITVALACNAYFTRRMRKRRATRDQASLATMVALLITPTVAAALVSIIVARLDLLFMGILLFSFGYAVGLVCFIILNRRYRRLSATDSEDTQR